MIEIKICLMSGPIHTGKIIWFQKNLVKHSLCRVVSCGWWWCLPHPTSIWLANPTSNTSPTCTVSIRKLVFLSPDPYSLGCPDPDLLIAWAWYYIIPFVKWDVDGMHVMLVVFKQPTFHYFYIWKNLNTEMGCKLDVIGMQHPIPKWDVNGWKCIKWDVNIPIRVKLPPIWKWDVSVTFHCYTSHLGIEDTFASGISGMDLQMGGGSGSRRFSISFSENHWPQV